MTFAGLCPPWKGVDRRQGQASWSVGVTTRPLRTSRPSWVGERELLWWRRGYHHQTQGVHSQIQGMTWGAGASRRWSWGPSWTRRPPGARSSPTSWGPAGSPCSSATPCTTARPGSQCSCSRGQGWSRRSS